MSPASEVTLIPTPTSLTLTSAPSPSCLSQNTQKPPSHHSRQSLKLLADFEANQTTDLSVLYRPGSARRRASAAHGTPSLVDGRRQQTSSPPSNPSHTLAPTHRTVAKHSTEDSSRAASHRKVRVSDCCLILRFALANSTSSECALSSVFSHIRRPAFTCRVREHIWADCGGVISCDHSAIRHP